MTRKIIGIVLIAGLILTALLPTLALFVTN